MVHNNPTHILKVPEGIVKLANQQGILNLLENWYALKSVSIDGYFSKAEIIGTIQQKCRLGSGAYKNLNKMVGLGWIIATRNGFNLVSYDKLFKYIGLNVELKRTKKGIRKGKFKIFKMNANRVRHFLVHVAYHEIKLNLKRQQFAVKHKRLSGVDTENTYWKRINSDITLACSGVARILGYRSKSMGHKIERLLIKHNLLEIKHRDRDRNLILIS